VGSAGERGGAMASMEREVVRRLGFWWGWGRAAGGEKGVFWFWFLKRRRQGGDETTPANGEGGRKLELTERHSPRPSTPHNHIFH
jgi:hypothetical protein